MNKNVFSYRVVLSWFLILTVLITVGCGHKSSFNERGKDVINSVKTTEYYPLAVGNKWTYEFIHRDSEGKTNKLVYSELIAGKSKAEKGKVRYYLDNSKEFMIETNDGIITTLGFFILKYPLEQGKEWISGRDGTDQRYTIIESLNADVKVKDKNYKCLKTVTSTDLITFVNLKRAYIQNELFFVKNVGLVKSETYEIDEKKNKTLISCSELVEFKTNQPVPAIKINEKKNVNFYDFTKAFRYPETGFYHPDLSPNEKWIIYFNENDDWGKMRYTKASEQKDYELPAYMPEMKDAQKVFSSGKWSPDGKYYVCRVRINSHENLAVVDFKGEKPVYLESFEGDHQFYWTKDGYIIYTNYDYQLNSKVFLKRKPGAQAQVLTKADGLWLFEIADDGTILFNCSGSGENRKDTNYFFNCKSNLKPQELSFSYLRNLSPNGVYALSIKGNAQYDNDVTLVNLKTNKGLLTWKMYANSSREDFRWSPDGKLLAYVQESPFAAEKPELHFIILNAETLEKKIYGFGIGSFTWSPDGKYIICGNKEKAFKGGTETTSGIWIIRVSDGKEIGRLSDIGSSDSPYISPSSEYIVWEGSNSNTFFVARNPFKEEMKN